LSGPAVAARGLVCQFGPVRAVDDLSFEVAEGEVFGLLGPNGAGKTTVIRVVTTLLKPAAGTMRVFGLDTRRSTMRVRRLIGYVPQQLSIDGQLTGYENAWLFARLFDVPRRERRGRVEDALAQVGLEKVAGRLASQVVVVLVLAAVLGVTFRWQPLSLLGSVAAVMLGSSFFASLSMTIAGLVRTRERLMGIGQAITMPLFFASNALYPTALMPGWVQAIARVNPLSYEVNALRQLLLGLPGNLAMDFAALLGATVAGITAASLLLGRLAR
jgi:hypothetical protein